MYRELSKKPYKMGVTDDKYKETYISSKDYQREYMHINNIG
jgi:hypothetical protein